MPQEKCDIKDPELEKIIADLHTSMRRRRVNTAIAINVIMSESKKSFNDLEEFLYIKSEFRNPHTDTYRKITLENKILDFFIKYQDMFNCDNDIDEFLFLTWKKNHPDTFDLPAYYIKDSEIITIYTIDKKNRRISMRQEKKPKQYSGRWHRNKY